MGVIAKMVHLRTCDKNGVKNTNTTLVPPTSTTVSVLAPHIHWCLPTDHCWDLALGVKERIACRGNNSTEKAGKPRSARRARRWEKILCSVT